MLRASVLAVAGAVALGGLILWLRGLTGPGLYALGFGLVVVLGTLFERWRYRPNDRRAGGWQATGERFEDPQTGKIVQVFYDARTGERRYVSDPESPPRAGAQR